MGSDAEQRRSVAIVGAGQTGIAAAPKAFDELGYRTTLANERTFLAWQGMALSLIVASVAVQSMTAATNSLVWSVAAVVLALLAVASAATGLIRWRHVDASRVTSH